MLDEKAGLVDRRPEDRAVRIGDNGRLRIFSLSYDAHLGTPQYDRTMTRRDSAERMHEGSLHISHLPILSFAAKLAHSLNRMVHSARRTRGAVGKKPALVLSGNFPSLANSPARAATPAAPRS